MNLKKVVVINEHKLSPINSIYSDFSLIPICELCSYLRPNPVLVNRFHALSSAHAIIPAILPSPAWSFLFLMDHKHKNILWFLPSDFCTLLSPDISYQEHR